MLSISELRALPSKDQAAAICALPNSELLAVAGALSQLDCHHYALLNRSIMSQLALRFQWGADNAVVIAK